MTDALLRTLVPRDWTADQALVAVRLLRLAIDAVWEVHGEEMARALDDHQARRERVWEDYFDVAVDVIDDDIPF